MRRLREPFGWAPFVLSLLLAACGEATAEEHVIDEPASYEDGRITMTEDAARRLGIETVPVAQDGDRLRVPSSAILVEPDGRFYVYVAEGDLAFVKERVALVSDDDGVAVLRDGPRPGTDVVTVAVPELYGIEYGVGH